MHFRDTCTFAILIFPPIFHNCIDDLPVDSATSNGEKADMRIVQAAALEVHVL